LRFRKRTKSEYRQALRYIVDSMRWLVKVVAIIAAIVFILLAFRHAGPALVVSSPQPSDVILVLAGDSNDQRYWKAIALLRAGYAPQVIVNARVDAISYGRTAPQLTQEFIDRTASDLPGRVGVCPTTGDSTLLELQSAATCLEPVAPHNIIVVTSDYHTRRALSIARKKLPRYTWTVAAADSGLLSSPKWWTNRAVAKNVFLEWQRLAWWEVVDRHR
jgi:uncharacterized SAM-binding protein YcdF (DUF218 family)